MAKKPLTEAQKRAIQENKKYWIERGRQDAVNIEKIGVNAMQKLNKVYRTNLKAVEKDIKYFLKKHEASAFEQMSLFDTQQVKAQFKKAIKDYPNANYLTEIYKKDAPLSKLIRLRELEYQLQLRIADITAYNEKELVATLKDVAYGSQEIYKKTYKELAGLTLGAIDDKLVNQIVGQTWVGKLNFSQRIWRDCDLVGQKVTKIMQLGITQGKGARVMARELRDELLKDVEKSLVAGASAKTKEVYNNAFRLIRTEATYVRNQVTLHNYVDLGVEYYEYDAFLDNVTSDICRSLNGQKFKIQEATIGVNYPPALPNCRSTTVPVID